MWLFGVSVIINCCFSLLKSCYFKADIPWGRGAQILVTFFIPDEFASLWITVKIALFNSFEYSELQ